MPKIKILATPPGQAPKWVREEWVGVEIPIPEQESGGIQMGIQCGNAENTDGYQVETRAAIEALRIKSPEAARWWEYTFLLAFPPRLVFSGNVCEVIQ